MAKDTDAHVVVTNVSKRGGGYGGEDDSCAMVYTSGKDAVPIMGGPFHEAREATKPYFNTGLLALKKYSAVYVGEDFSGDLRSTSSTAKGTEDVSDFMQGNTILFRLGANLYLVVGCGRVTTFKLEPKDSFVAYVSNVDPGHGAVENFIIGEKFCYLLGDQFLCGPHAIDKVAAAPPLTLAQLRAATKTVRALKKAPSKPVRVLHHWS
jgi:hypothetical protein